MNKSTKRRSAAVFCIALVVAMVLSGAVTVWSADPAGAANVQSQNNLKSSSANDAALEGAAKQKALLDKTKKTREPKAQGQTGPRGYGGDASGIVGSTSKKNADLKLKGAEAFKNANAKTKQTVATSKRKVVGGSKLDKPFTKPHTVSGTWFNVGAAGHGLSKKEISKHGEGARVGKPGDKTKKAVGTSKENVIGGFQVGTAVGRAIGNPANDGDENAAEENKSSLLKMLTSDYTGTGQPFTVSGQPLNWGDEKSWMGSKPGEPKGPREAEWRPGKPGETTGGRASQTATPKPK